ncbi:MAG: hypothetical protein U9O82_01470 [Thermodesulfobacteriota bacterium]|nr:hypothetical protein [Thermodesulfobacteriota bacterium]
MKKNKFAVIFLIPLLLVTFSATSANAGSRERHRWEGAAIGIGSLVLGGILVDRIGRQCTPRREHVYVYLDPPQRLRKKRGHWEMRRKWVEPSYERVWNPGHYNRHGKWVYGRWIMIVDKEGYWIEEQVRVKKRRHRNHSFYF